MGQNPFRGFYEISYRFIVPDINYGLEQAKGLNLWKKKKRGRRNCGIDRFRIEPLHQISYVNSQQMRFTGSKGNKQKETDRQISRRTGRNPSGPYTAPSAKRHRYALNSKPGRPVPLFPAPHQTLPSTACQMVEEHRLAWFLSCETRLKSFHPFVNKTKSFPDYFFVALSSLNLCCQTGGISDQYFLKHLRPDRMFKNRCIPLPSRASLNKIT